MGGAASGARGSAYERELVRHFAAHGWGALRLPSSGSATTRDLPDVLVGRPVVYPRGDADKIVIENRSDAQGERFSTEAWAIEAKSGKATTLYVDGDEVDALEAFARQWGARPLLGARSTRQGTPTEHYLLDPADARQTDGGNYGLPIDGIEDRAFAVVGEEGIERL